MPIKIPIQFFIELERATLKFIWNNEKPRIAKTILNNKRNSGESVSRTSSNIAEQNCMVLVQCQAGGSPCPHPKSPISPLPSPCSPT